MTSLNLTTANAKSMGQLNMLRTMTLLLDDIDQDQANRVSRMAALHSGMSDAEVASTNPVGAESRVQAYYAGISHEAGQLRRLLSRCDWQQPGVTMARLRELTSRRGRRLWRQASPGPGCFDTWSAHRSRPVIYLLASTGSGLALIPHNVVTGKRTTQKPGTDS